MLSSHQGRNSIAHRALEAFYRHQKLFWIATLGMPLLVGVALYLRSASYVASASTQVVADQEVATVLGLTRHSWISPAQQNVSRFNDLLRDDEPGGFLDDVLKNARLARPMRVDPRVRDKRFAELRSKLAVQVNSNDVFTISLVWDNAGECERILRALQSGYVEEAGASRQAQSIATASFLDTQIQSYRYRMRVAEKALIQYKREHFGQLPESASGEIEQLALLRSERDYLRIASQDAILQRGAIEARLTQVKPTSILEETTSKSPKAESPTAANLQSIEARRVALLSGDYRADGSMIKPLDAQIRVLRNRLAQEQNAERVRERSANGASANVVQTTTQANPEYTSLSEQLTQAKIEQATNTSRLALLDQNISEYEKRVRLLPDAARELTDKTRDYSIMKEQYEDLLKRREQAQIKANLDKVAATSTLVPIGTVYASASNGIKKNALILVGTVVFGVIVGSGLILGAELADPSVRYAADVEKMLGVPVVLCLPAVRVISNPRHLLASKTVADPWWQPTTNPSDMPAASQRNQSPQEVIQL
ncbi:MAG: hypothetical protein H7Y38_01690 [Armatimonadetes bacterium]|nr:hypothetical protein [Armatimonadota bacterium]